MGAASVGCCKSEAQPKEAERDRDEVKRDISASDAPIVAGTEEKLPEGWAKQWSKSKEKFYYYNASTGENLWHAPPRTPPVSNGAAAPKKAASAKKGAAASPPKLQKVAEAQASKGPAKEDKYKAPEETPEQKNAKEAVKLQEKGQKAFANNEWDSALESYSAALKLDEKLVSAWAGRGGVKLRKGKHAEALADLNEAMRLDEGNLFAMRDRAEARFKTGDVDGAIADYNKKLSLAPGDGRSLCGRGECKLKKGDKDGAIRDFELAARLTYPGAADLMAKAKKK